MPHLDEPYFILKAGQQTIGGILTSSIREASPTWLPYVATLDIDDTIARARARGGELLAPLTAVPNIGRFGIVKDPSGALLGFVAPTTN